MKVESSRYSLNVKLNFLSAWKPGNKENTWSGTNWGLFQALQKYFFVNDIDFYHKYTLE